MSRAARVVLATVLAFASAAAPAPSAPAAAQNRGTVVAGDLEFPTNMAIAPDGRIFFTEKETGRVRVIQDGRLLPRPFAEFDVIEGAETGMLGLTLHPDFPETPWVYLYYSSADDLRNHVVRVRAEGNLGTSTDELVTLLSAVAGYHNGGDITFGPDGKLYVSAGEGHDQPLAQDPESPGGKILRLEPDGSVPEDNPFPGSPVFSLGHRNSFGLCFDTETGELWETENGPTENDEINLIEAGANYGWPDVSGNSGDARFRDPELVFRDVIVPTGCVARGGRLLFGDFNGRLWSYDPTVNRRARVIAAFPSGVTDLQWGPDGSLYVATAEEIRRLDDLVVPRKEPESKTPAVTPDRKPIEGPGPRARAVLGGAAALLVALAGGLALYQWQRRTERRRTSSPDA